MYMIPPNQIHGVNESVNKKKMQWVINTLGPRSIYHDLWSQMRPYIKMRYNKSNDTNKVSENTNIWNKILAI